jgi:DNA-binding response OmpR family regulator
MEILVVEDEVLLAQHISRALTEAGHEPVMVHDGETALGKADLKRYDLIVLDVMLPGMDGFEVLRRLRATKIDTRVLILTARGEVSDRVTGLGLGRGRLPREALRNAGTGRASECARATFSRGSAYQAPNRRFGFEPGRQKTVSRARAGSSLSARELMLLRVLMREPGRTFSRTELCERVWEREHAYGVKLVEAFISRLRKKIRLAAAYPHR